MVWPTAFILFGRNRPLQSNPTPGKKTKFSRLQIAQPLSAFKWLIRIQPRSHHNFSLKISFSHSLIRSCLLAWSCGELQKSFESR